MFEIISSENMNEVANHYVKAFCNNEWDIPKSRIRIHEFMNHPQFRGYTYVVDGSIVSAVFGTLQQYYDGMRYILTDLFTTPEHQNKGYATELLDFVKNELRNEGVKQIMLTSLDDDLHNHFYDEKNGFVTRKELCIKRFILNG